MKKDDPLYRRLRAIFWTENHDHTRAMLVYGLAIRGDMPEISKGAVDVAELWDRSQALVQEYRNVSEGKND